MKGYLVQAKNSIKKRMNKCMAMLLVMSLVFGTVLMVQADALESTESEIPVESVATPEPTLRPVLENLYLKYSDNGDDTYTVSIYIADAELNSFEYYICYNNANVLGYAISDEFANNNCCVNDVSTEDYCLFSGEIEGTTKYTPAYFKSVYLGEIVVEKVDYSQTFSLVNAINGKEKHEITVPAWGASVPQNPYSDVYELTDQTFTADDYDCVLLSDGTVKIKDYNGSEKDLTVPSEINGYRVTMVEFGYGCEFETLVLPEGITIIDGFKFSGCRNMKSIYIPESVTYIDENAFNSCSSLEQINVNENNKYYCSDDGVLYTKDKKYLMRYPAAKKETSYIIPSYVKNIYNRAFYECANIEKVSLPDGVVMIYYGAFGYCYNLTEITLPESLISIGYRAFGDCKNLSNIILPDNLVYLEDYAFYGCESLESIIFPDNITTIEENVFCNCYNLKNFFVSKNVKEIKNSAFNECKSLDVIEVDENNLFYSSINGDLYNKEKTKLIRFTNESNVGFYMIPENVTAIGSYAFNDSDLKKVIIPGNVKQIDEYAFYGCHSIERVVMFEGVEQIDSAFVWCNNLVTVVIPDTVIIGNTPCINCYLDNIIASQEFISNMNMDEMSYEWKKRYNDTGVASDEYFTDDYFYTVSDDNTATLFDYIGNDSILEIPEEINGYAVTGIGDGGFSYCTNLTEVKIPKSITDISLDVFDGCENLSVINVDAENSHYKSIDGVLFDSDVNEMIQYPTGKTDSDYMLPDGVKQITAGAFENRKNLVKITIPESVVEIGDNAFKNCTNLSEVNIKNANVKFGNNVFINTKLLKDNKLFVLGNRLIVCDKGAEGTICIPEGITEICDSAFEQCVNITEIVIPSSVDEIGKRAFLDCSGLTNICIPESVTSIGDCAFQGCSNLTEINLPDGISVISDCTFRYCSKLNELIIPDGVTEVGTQVFTNCSSLDNLVVPESVKIFGAYAFTGCKWYTDTFADEEFVIINNVLLACYPKQKLTDVIIPYGVEKINRRAFAFADVKSITLPESVIEIDIAAFHKCLTVEKITIPKSLKLIRAVSELGVDLMDNSVTGSCLKLTDIYYNGNKEEWMTIDNKDNVFSGYTIHYSDGTSEIIVPTPTIEPTVSPTPTESILPTSRPEETEVPGTTEPSIVFELGHVDDNGKVDANDALWVLKCAARMADLTEAQRMAADVNKDSKVDAKDALQILKYAAKIIDHF